MELSGTTVRVAGTAMERGVPREKVRRITLVHDTAARYPFARFFMGFVLSAVGGIGVVILLLTGSRGALPFDVERGVVSLNLVPFSLWMMLGLGLWLLMGVFRSVYQLEIATDERTERIVLGRSADLPRIRQFIRNASWSFAYEIDSSILDHPEARPDA